MSTPGLATRAAGYAVSVHTDLVSIGFLAQLLQQSPADIERACAQTGIEADQRQNGVLIFSVDKIPAIRRALKR